MVTVADNTTTNNGMITGMTVTFDFTTHNQIRNSVVIGLENFGATENLIAKCVQTYFEWFSNL